MKSGPSNPASILTGPILLIHLTVLEQGRDPYWIDDVVFDGAPGVGEDYRREAEKRGGPGIVRLQPAPNGAWLAKRNIILLAK